MLLTSWLNGWSGRARLPQSDWPAARRRRRRRENVLALVEVLETRQLLTVNAVFNPIDATHGALHIDTAAADNIIVSVSSVIPNAVLVNGNTVFNGGQFLLTTDSNFTGLDILATGNFANLVDLSLVTFGAFTHLTGATVNAGDGPDTVNGSEFADSVFGGPGNDLLNGRQGNDLLDGGGGLDFLRGGDGNDVLRNGFDSDGQLGNDLIVIDMPLDTQGVLDITLMSESIQLGADLKTAGGRIALDGSSVRLMSDVTITTTSGASSGFVQIKGQLDSAAGPSVYTLVTTPRSYAEAQMQAAIDVPGGYLVTIRSAAEQSMAKAAAGNNDVWIGASDAESEGKWKWDGGPDFGVQFWNGDATTGNPVNNEYSNWFPGEPDDLPNPGDAAFLKGNDAVGGSSGLGGWSDGDGNTPRAYLVESPTAFSLAVNSGTANVLLDGPVGNQVPLRSLSVTSNRTDVTGGSISTFKTQTFNSSIALGGPTLLRAEEVNFIGVNSSVSGTGSLTLAPIKRDAPITVGSTADAGAASFDITDSDIAALAAGFASIQIGEPPFNGPGGVGMVQSMGPVTVTTATFLSPVAIAGGSISVTGLNAGTNKVDLIASLGSITDGGNSVVDITAGELSLDSATGVGTTSDPLDTSATAIASRGAVRGDVVISNTGNLAIGSPTSPGGIFTNNGLVSVATTGSISVLRSIVSNGGNVSLTATNGIVIAGVPVDTSAPDGSAGSFTADANSDNNGSGTFSINSMTDFVDWTSTTQGVFADGTTVNISTTTFASAFPQTSPSNTPFNNGNIYFPAQASGDFVETRFSQVGEAVFFTFSKAQFGLFLHFDGMQVQDPLFVPADPVTGNPINLYTFDRMLSKVSGESTWEVDQATNSIRQISGNHLADQDGTVRFDEGVSSLTFSRAAPGVDPGFGIENIVNVQLGLFRAGGIKAPGGSITIRAADMNLDGFIDAGSETVSLIPKATIRSIDLGAAGGTGQFVLTDAELDRIMAGTVQIGNANSGAITVNADISHPNTGVIILTAGTGRNINLNASVTTAGGPLTLSNAVVLGANVALDTTNAGAIPAGADISVVGAINLAANTLTWNAGEAPTSISTVISGTGGAITKQGSGTLTLGGTNTYTGETKVSSGTMTLNGSITSDVLVQGTGIFAGTGAILGTHTLTIGDGGTLAPGNSPGILNSGSVTLDSGSNFNVELNGTQVGQDYDQLNVTGTVDLNGGTLNVTSGFTPAAGDIFEIIKNDGSDVVNGTFSGLAQGSLLDVGGNPFHIYYNFASGGGAANDVALIANRLPMFSAQSFNVDETATAGTVIGTVVATDADSAVTFAITSGNSSNTFALAPTSGQLTVNDATALAGSNSFSLTVEVTDDAGATKSALITINVLGPAPVTPIDSDGTNSNRNEGLVPEGAIPGMRVGITLFATDPQGDQVFYRLTDDAGGRFTVDPITGVVTVKTSHLLNFADATQHTIRAQAVDAGGHASPEATFSIDVVEVPVNALPIASILPSRVSVVEGDSTDPGNKFISFLVKLNKPSTSTVQLDFSTRVGGEPGFVLPEGIPLTASFATDEPGPWDFFRSSGRLTFDPGVTEQLVRVQLRPDDRVEPNELFFVQLTSPINVQLAAGQSVAVAQILDDDLVPQVIVENAQVLEGDTPGQNELVFHFRLIGDFPLGQSTATVEYSTGNIAIDTAIAGIDYTSVADTLTFTDTNREQEIHIPIIGDLVDAADKTVSLHFTNAVNLGLSRDFAVGTIVNDDSPNVVVSVTPSLFKIREGNSGTQQVEFIVNLVGKPTTDVTVSYATADHRATAGSDYVAASGVVTFALADIAAGIVQKSIFVTINGDTDIEPDEGFTLSLSLPTSPPNVSLDPDRSLARVILRNDDQAVLTEDGDELFAQLLTDLTGIFNAGGGAKNNPAFIAEMQRQALLIARSLGLTRAIIMIIDPVDFVVTDPSDRQSGYTESTGVVNTIPGTYYSGDGAVELLIVPLPDSGTYNVQLASLGGDFNASITIVNGDGTTSGVVSDFSGQFFQNGQLAVQVGDIKGIPVGLGLTAANSGAIGTFGVVGAFGHAEFRLALASALEQATSDGFDLADQGSRATGLMYWLTVSARVVRQQLIDPLWQSLGSPLGDLLGEGRLTRIEIPSEFVDQFWSQVGQTLTGVPAGIYRLGNMLESVIPTLVPRRVRSTLPRSGDQGQPNSSPSSGVKTKRSSLERPRVAPPNGQAQPPSKPNATKDKSAQTPSSRKVDGQQASTPHTRWLWFAFKDEKSATQHADRRGA